MDKRQGTLAAILGLVIAAGLAFWWTTREPEMPPPTVQPTLQQPAPMPATVSTPLSGGASTDATVESDAVALEEEVVDQIQKENEDLASRAVDLEAQVQDGEALIALKEKQIRELEAQLKQQAAGSPTKP